MSRHLERLLELDRLIRLSERHTANTLAEALEVSERTVRNDLDFMRDRYNAPIASDRQKGYFYSDPNWRLDGIPLTKGELFASMLRQQQGMHLKKRRQLETWRPLSKA